MLDFAIKLVESLGIFGAGLFIAIESIVIPLPSELVLLLSGFNVSTGEFSFLPLWITTSIGSLIGALVLYSLGFGFSRNRLQRIVSRYGKYLGVTESDLNKTFTIFERYGSAVIFIGRLFPLIRSLVSIPAGLARMNLIKFSLLTLAGSSIFNAIWIYIGIQLGDKWRDAEDWANALNLIVNIGLVLVVTVIVARAIRNWSASKAQ
ncbi:MAG: DedA family protein [Candidatus Nanopelagicaceae bacterium]